MAKRQGALVYSRDKGRYDVRFGLDDYYGGLHCGDCMDIRLNGRWVPTRMEYFAKWYLIGVNTDALDGLVVRI